MPHLTGVFDQFSDLDKVSPENLSAWTRVKIDKHDLVNILGNRILYPQTISINKTEIELDLGILREGLKQRPALVYEAQTNKLYIPEMFLARFPPLSRLAGVIIEAINPKGVIQIFLRGQSKVKLIGTLISPPDLEKLVEGKSKIRISVDGVEGMLNPNTLSISQIEAPQVKIKIEDKEYTVSGGELGVIIDIRTNS